MVRNLPQRHPHNGRFVTTNEQSKPQRTEGGKPKPDVRATTHKQPPPNKGGKK